MSMWYETIQDDKQLNTLLSNEMRRSSGEYSKLNHHFLRPILDEIGYIQRIDPRIDPYASTQAHGYGGYSPPSVYDVRSMNDKELGMVIRNIGEALFMSLVELNPAYAKRLLGHGLRCVMDGELSKLEQRDNQRRYKSLGPTSIVDHAASHEEYMVTPSRRPKLVTADYEYWWDYSECGSAIYVMSDYDGTPTTGLVEIEFDPDEPDEVNAAVQEAEDTVRKLCNNQLDINDLVNRSNDLQSRSGTTATEIAMKMKPQYDVIGDVAAQFETTITTEMMKNMLNASRKFGILSDNIT